MKIKEESENGGLKFNIQKIKIMASSPITSWQIDGEIFETVRDSIFVWVQNHCRWWLQPWNEKMLAPWEKNYDQPRQYIKKQRHYFANKVCLVKAMVFPLVMYAYENWTMKIIEHWRIDTFELSCWRRLLRAPWTARRSDPVHPKGNQSWVFIGRTDVEAETAILWPPDEKWLIWKDPDAGKDWRWEQKGTTEDEIIGSYHRHIGHLFE